MMFHLLISLALIAGIPLCRAQNSLRLFSPQGELFQLNAGGNYINQHPQAEVLMEHIDSDTLKIKLECENRAPVEVTLYLTDRGKKISNKEFDFTVDFSKSLARLSFTGMYTPMQLQNPLVPAMPAEDTSFKYNNNLLGHFCELKEGRPNYFNNLPVRGCTEPMPAVYMDYVKLLMARSQTDDGLFTVAENVCRNNCISTAQLGGLLAYINYEVEKLKLVRIAYFNLTDTLNRNRLQTSFRFESSVRELNRFFASTGEYRLSYGGHCKTAADSSVIRKYCLELAAFGNDAQRYEALKKTYERYCFSIEQARLVLDQFIHDREKLETAKLLYFYCPEKQNYGTLADVFSYKETAAELSDFMTKQTGK